MRGFLLFLALSFPVVIASPSFWSLVSMEASAERVGYVHENGVTQWAWLGPKSPWPAWAPVPAGAKLTVRAQFDAAPGQIASGFADLQISNDATGALSAYGDALTRDGWSVQYLRIDASTADLPPRALHLCLVEARKQGRALRLSLERDTRPTVGSLYWAAGEVRPALGAVAGPC